jgi:Cu(I)/Ag(I) efflux system membrane protein CusA/SilA
VAWPKVEEVAAATTFLAPDNNDEQDLLQAIIEGAALRVRPIAMTVAVIIAGLLPIMWGSGTGSEIMRRIASPMVGGMITAPILSMIVVPVVYMLMRRRALASRSDHGLTEQT